MSALKFFQRLLGRCSQNLARPTQPDARPELLATERRASSDHEFSTEDRATGSDMDPHLADGPLVEAQTVCSEGEARPPSPRAALLPSAADRPIAWQEGDLVAATYEVIGVLGEGGFGTVYRVRHKHWNRDLAVKRPRSEGFQTISQREAFTKEAETWVNLGLHPHLATCYYVRTLDGVPTVFAECVEGGSLAQWIRTRKVYEGSPESILTRILDIAIQIAWGLQQIHDQGLVHRDVKPGNVLLTPEGVAKVTDFGLVQANSKMFTLRYCSPEQQRGLLLTTETDVWSWAVTILELFLGKACWQTGPEAPRVLAEYQRAIREDRSIPQMPDRLCKILGQCFEPNPVGRPRSMESLVEALMVSYRAHTNGEYHRERPNTISLRSGNLNNRALSLLDLGRREEALAAWLEALEIDPHHLESTFNFGIHRWQRGVIDDITLIRQLEEVRTTCGDRRSCEHLLGLVHQQRGDPVAAEPFLLAAQPRSASAVVEPLADGGHSKGRDGLSVASIALSHDGRWALSGDHRGTISLWDANERRRIRVFEAYGFGPRVSPIGSVALSPDGRTAASGNWDSDASLWSLVTGERIQRLEGHSSPVDCVSFSPDGRFVLTGARDEDEMRLWDAGTGACIRTFPGHGKAVSGEGGSIKALCFSPDGRLALSGGAHRTLRLWQLETGKYIWSIDLEAAIHVVSFSSDGRLAAVVAWDIQIWDLNMGKCIRSLSSSTKCLSIAFSKDSHWCVAGYNTGALRIWEIETGRCARTVDIPEGLKTGYEVNENVQVNENTDDDPSLQHWLMEFQTLGVDDLTVSASADRAVFSYAGGRGLYFYKLRSLAPCYLEFQVSSPVEAAAMEAIEKKARAGLADARSVLDAGRYREAYSTLREIQQLPGYERSEEIWELLGACSTGRRTGLHQAWLKWSLPAHRGGVQSVAVSGDGKLAFTGGIDNLVRLWDVGQQRHLESFKGHENGVTSVAASSDGRWVVSGSHDHTIRIWDVATRVNHAVLRGHVHWVNCVAISADNRFILSGSRDGTARLWNCVTRECLRVLGRPDSKGHPGRMILSTAFSPEGRRAVLGRSDGVLLLWSLDDGRLIREFRGHKDGARAVFSHDGDRILSGSLDSTIRLWNIEGGNSLIFHGHTEGVICVAFFADGHWVLSCGRDGTLRLWESGSNYRAFKGHDGVVAAIAIAPDGRWCLSAGADGTLRRWDFDWLQWFPEESTAPKELKLLFHDVDGWVRTPPLEFADPGQGFAIPYNSNDSAASVTVYVYDRGLSWIEDDLASEMVMKEFSVCIRGMEAARAQGQYQELKQEVVGQYTLGGLRGTRKALYGRFSARINTAFPRTSGIGNQELVTELYLLPYRDHFIKVRSTFPRDRWISLNESLDHLYNELSVMLG